MGNKIKTILFDMDGVLVKAKDWHYEAFNMALEEFGYTPVPYETHLARLDGLPTRKKLALLSAEQKIPESEFEPINTRKQALTQHVINMRCVPSPGLSDTIMRLKSDGYSMAVCSNSVRASVDLILRRMQILPYFEFFLSNEDVKRPKPDPEIYATAMDRLGAFPKETVVLEDNPFGIAAARAAGAHVVEILNVDDVRYNRVINEIRLFEQR